MKNNINSKRPKTLSPIWTLVIAVVTLMGMYFLVPEGDSNFYITAFFMIVAVIGVLAGAMAVSGTKGYGYPRKITLQVVAWRYFLTQFVVSLVFISVPFILGWSFKIEVKRYLITHLAVLTLFATSAILLFTGKRQLDEAKLADIHNSCAYVHRLRERVRTTVSGKEQRILAINELDELYTAISYANPVYSDSLAYLESEIKQELGLLDECVDKLAEDNGQDIDALARICKSIKDKIQEREELIQKECAE